MIDRDRAGERARFEREGVGLGAEHDVRDIVRAVRGQTVRSIERRSEDLERSRRVVEVRIEQHVGGTDAVEGGALADRHDLDRGGVEGTEIAHASGAVRVLHLEIGRPLQTVLHIEQSVAVDDVDHRHGGKQVGVDAEQLGRRGLIGRDRVVGGVLHSRVDVVRPVGRRAGRRARERPGCRGCGGSDAAGREEQLGRARVEGRRGVVIEVDVAA